MKRIGGTLLFFGAGSVVLNLIGMEFIILMWMDLAGPAVGWFLRGSMIVVGAALLFMGRSEE